MDNLDDIAIHVTLPGEDPEIWGAYSADGDPFDYTEAQDARYRELVTEAVQAAYPKARVAAKTAFRLHPEVRTFFCPSDVADEVGEHVLGMCDRIADFVLTSSPYSEVG